MRSAIAALTAILISIGTVFASSSDEGRITAIDPERMVITLENGNSYKLPGEFNMEAIEVGTEVFLAYEQIDGQRQITDMDITE